MTKPSRPHGTLPAAFSATGQDVPPSPQDVPPSPDVAAHNLGEVIGQSVAYHVTALLAPVLQRLVDVQERYACVICVDKAKREWNVAAANARSAAEPEPKVPAINQSFTEGRRGPVCWSCFEPDDDGPMNMVTEPLLTRVRHPLATLPDGE